MAVTTVQIKSATVKIAGTDHAAQFRNVTLTTETNDPGTGDRTLDGSVIPSAATYTDKVTGTVVQDWPAPGGGLIGYADTHRGEWVAIEVKSIDPAGTTFTGKVRLDPLDRTLDPNETATADVDWSLTDYVPTYPAPAAPLADDDGA